ncbi:hypothetical protein L5515_001817 [Caenorhabditis briggsae]|uniref:Potassium channel domain-containing protein n=1 Tax=Caenorhabditis briggsae TaxID=6238 RepID=A0AAE9E2H3_CAEBR|nr:hypothetical protein L5515_001817 [Caenorhabditis briggsae]
MTGVLDAVHRTSSSVMEAYERKRGSASPTPLIRMANPQTPPPGGGDYRSDGTHRHTDRLIDKFMKRKIENAPPETHHLVRKQSVFNFVKREEKEKPKQTTFKKIRKKIRKFNTIIAFIILVAYICGGAALFWQIESNSDKKLDDYHKNVLQKSKELYKALPPNQCGPLKPNHNEINNKCLKLIYESLYNLNPPRYINTYLDGLAYVLTCITTIGYGQLVCRTIVGKMVTVVYGIIGIALTIYVLRHNGKVALRVCNWALGLVASCWRVCGNKKVKFRMTVTKSFILLFTFWTLGSLGIASYEKFVFWDAIYFSFSTFSTVGFGDLVPTSHISGVIIFALHFIDLCLLSMVFVLVHVPFREAVIYPIEIQQTMENNFMKVLELLDEGYRKHTTELNTGTMNLQSPGASKRLQMSTARETK